MLKLNPEIKSYIKESTALRDIRIVAKQTKLSASLAIIDEMIEELFQHKPSDSNNSLLEHLSGAGSLFADLQHDEFYSRKNLIVANTPNASVKKILADTDIGEFLFDEKLDEVVKSAKAVAATFDELREPQAKNSAKQPKDTKGPPRRSRNYNRASTGGQWYFQRGFCN